MAESVELVYEGDEREARGW